ncbi:MAG: polysaccharide deacetylase family protein [Haloechinothrix sp.]
MTGSPRTVAILAYHKIGRPPNGGWDTWFFVSEEIFAGHLASLRESGWTVLGLSAFLRGLDDPATLPDKGVLLTFDDGYRSTRTVALPWLRRFSYPAVVFVPTDFVGRCNSFDNNEPDEPLCDWDDLRALALAGIAVQSHGASHRSFADLLRAEMDDEIRRSKQVLEDGLDQAVVMLAYPYGDGGPDGLAPTLLERAGYRAACRYKGGRFRVPVADRFRLRRVAMGPDTDLGRALGG